jgi:hypothetical protein
MESYTLNKNPIKLRKRKIQKIQRNKLFQVIINFVNILLILERGSLTTVHNVSATAKTGTNPADIVGYMPKRRDFEVEYDNDAELLLA